MATPVGGSGSDYVSYKQMMELNRIMESNDVKGARVTEEAQKPAETDTLDVIIISRPGAFKGAADTSQIDKTLAAKGVDVQDTLDNIGGVEAKIKPEQLESLQKDGYVVFDNSPRNFMPGMPKVQLLGNQWDMPRIDPVKMTHADDIHARGLTGKGETWAVVDSGFNFPKFNAKFWKDIAGNSSRPDDKVGHGTHVGGDIHQLAPDTEIGFVRVMGPDGSGRPSDIVKGLKWVDDNRHTYKITGVNLSLGGERDGMPYYLDPINMAVETLWDHGVTVISAAGNSGPESMTIGSPADDPKAIAVGAALNPKRVSDFSSRGPTDDGEVKPDFTAPGEYIVSWMVPDSEMGKTASIVQTLRNMSADQLTQLLMQKPDLIEALGLPEDILEKPPAELEATLKNSLPPMYVVSKETMAAPGTSFAAPISSGIAGAIRGGDMNITPDDIKNALNDTADNMGSQYGKYDQGHGFINADNAAKKLGK